MSYGGGRGPTSFHSRVGTGLENSSSLVSAYHWLEVASCGTAEALQLLLCCDGQRMRQPPRATALSASTAPEHTVRRRARPHCVKSRSRMDAAPVQNMAGDWALPSRLTGTASWSARPCRYHVQNASATDARSCTCTHRQKRHSRKAERLAAAASAGGRGGTSSSVATRTKRRERCHSLRHVAKAVLRTRREPDAATAWRTSAGVHSLRRRTDGLPSKPSLEAMATADAPGTPKTSYPSHCPMILSTEVVLSRALSTAPRSAFHAASRCDTRCHDEKARRTIPTNLRSTVLLI
eukprot:scaffold36122_cov31-Tisochrysis_lutea.AAC.3